MSWMKFWNRKSKKDSKSRSELVRSESFKEETNWQAESEKDKNARLRHTMSISRSGRFKQRQKQRAGILDKPEFYDGNAPTSDGQKENVPSNGVPQSRHTPANHTNDIHINRSPPGTCRDVSGKNMAARRYEGQTTVL